MRNKRPKGQEKWIKIKQKQKKKKKKKKKKKNKKKERKKTLNKLKKKRKRNKELKLKSNVTDLEHMYIDAIVDHYLPYRYVYHYHNYAKQ